MIEIVKGTEVGYAYDTPVLVVKHQMSKANVSAVIAAARMQFGSSAIIDMLIEQGILTSKDPAKVPYYVSVDGGKAPAVPHPNVEHAIAEAERLAKNNPNNTVRVLRECHTRRYAAKTVTNYEMEKA